VNTTLMELKLPETRLPDESVVELFELLKVNRTMTSLTVPVVTQSKVLLPITWTAILVPWRDFHCITFRMVS
jgi:hypothetical protein